MEVAVRKQDLSLIDKLYENPRSFSFEMAALILEYGSPVPFGKETSISQSPLRTFSINSFHLRGTEIEKITEEYGKKVIYIERLTLTGWSGPMPTPYSEFIFRRTLNKDTAISNFLNAFNMRLLGISYQISALRFNSMHYGQVYDKYLLLRSQASFYGTEPLIKVRSLARLSYLLWMKEKSAAGLETIIRSLFQIGAHVEQFAPTWDELTEKTFLNRRAQLGKNSLIGTKVYNVSYGIKVHLICDDFATLKKLFHDDTYLKEIKFMIEKYLGNFIDYSITITPKKVPPQNINDKIRLGITSWLPYKNHNSESKYQTATLR